MRVQNYTFFFIYKFFLHNLILFSYLCRVTDTPIINNNIMTYNSLHKRFSSAPLLAAFFMAFSVSCQNAAPTVAEEPFASLEDLEGKTVAIITGSTSDVLLSDTHNFADITLHYCDSPTALLSDVENGDADCGISDTVLLMTRQKEHSGLKVYFNLPGGFDVAVACNPKDAELCNMFNSFLVQIKSDGTLDEMFARWCNPTPGTAQLSLDSVHIPELPGLEELQGRPIEVATLPDNEPFSFYRHNRWTGLEVEMMMRFSIFVGRPVHFSGYAFGEIIDILRQGRADMAAANMFITPDRSAQVLFSHPYYLCKTCCFGKK